MREPVVQEGRCAGVEWAACATAAPGERRSGDAYLVQETGAGVLIGVVDGLGHGDEAADVAERALASLRETAGRSVPQSLTACHKTLHGSRGVVMTVAALDLGAMCLTWAAVGNVDAALLRRRPRGGGVDRWSVPLFGGVLGDRLPPVRESTVDLAMTDTLIAATDGVSPDFLDGVDLSLRAEALARRLHTRFATGDDDALVLVARWIAAQADRPVASSA